MKIEDKVVSLELARKMKELWWEFKTERYWRKKLLVKDEIWEVVNSNKVEGCVYIPAPDAIEIGERLPENCFTEKWHNRWHGYVNEKNESCDEEFNEDSEAEARGKCWCYLTEKGLLKEEPT